MAEIKDTPKVAPFEAERTYEQPHEAISFYSDTAQVIHTGPEVILQFYETIPGVPASSGQIPKVTTRLRATITISIPHAKNLGALLTEKIGVIK
jgi:hypothetical protein